MDLVVDANILFAALVKENKTAELLFHDELHLYAPEYILQEFSEHKGELLEKTHRPPEDFHRLVEIFARRINIIPAEETRPFTEEACSISPDPDDVPYFALAIKLRAEIWSNDNRLQGQDKVRVWKTHEIAVLSV